MLADITSFIFLSTCLVQPRSYFLFSLADLAQVVVHRVGVPAKKRPRTKEQGSRQASCEWVVPPKKRKTPHTRMSKRATSPGIIDDDEWAMLEREEEEQPLRHGKGPTNRSKREDSPFDEFEVDYSDDEYEGEGVHPIYLENHPKRDYSWESTKKY